jgi:hypothetical protein
LLFNYVNGFYFIVIKLLPLSHISPGACTIKLFTAVIYGFSQ